MIPNMGEHEITAPNIPHQQICNFAHIGAPTLNWRIEKRRSTRGQNSAFFNDDSYRFKRGQNDLLFCNLTNLINYINRQVFLPETEA